MKNNFTATLMEKKVINYFIQEAFLNKNYIELDHSFQQKGLVRGKPELWKNIYGSIRGQLRINPNDLEGYSITPSWVRNVFKEYRQSDYHDCWEPNGMNLESIPHLVKETTQHCTKEILAYSNDNCKTLHAIPCQGETKDFIRGYLKAVNAENIYRITIEKWLEQ